MRPGHGEITAPSYATLGRLFAQRGWTIDFMHYSPDSMEVTQLTIHIAVCALLVFFVGYGLGWIASRSRRRWLPELSSPSSKEAGDRKTESLKIFKL